MHQLVVREIVKMKRLSGILLASMLILAGCGAQTHTIDGEFTLFAETDGPTSNCVGRGGYSDIKEGLSVTVRNESGTILATSRLSRGSRSIRTCTFTFSVSDVPRSEFYSIEVGRRGELTYSHEEMVERGWEVFASLGR